MFRIRLNFTIILINEDCVTEKFAVPLQAK